MSTCPPPEADVHPTDPEPVGPLAEKFLHRLAAQGTDEERAARRAEALNRLRRQNQPNQGAAAVTTPMPPASALPVDDLRDVPPNVLAMADRTVLRLHELIDGAPLALVVNAYRAGRAHGQQQTAETIARQIDEANANAKAAHYKAALNKAAKIARSAGEVQS